MSLVLKFSFWEIMWGYLSEIYEIVLVKKE